MYIAYASSGTSGLGGSWMSLIMIAVIFVALYFFTIRPQSKRDKELKNFRNALKPGDEVVTIGGIYGKVVRITDDRVVIAVGSEKVKLEMAKSAISSYADPSTASSASAKTKEAEAPEKEAKPTPKTIKKLGAAKKETEATVAEALDEVSEKTE